MLPYMFHDVQLLVFNKCTNIMMSYLGLNLCFGAIRSYRKHISPVVSSSSETILAGSPVSHYSFGKSLSEESKNFNRPGNFL